MAGHHDHSSGYISNSQHSMIRFFSRLFRITKPRSDSPQPQPPFKQDTQNQPTHLPGAAPDLASISQEQHQNTPLNRPGTEEESSPIVQNSEEEKGEGLTDHEDEAMAPYNKRGGHKRGGFKPQGPRHSASSNGAESSYGQASATTPASRPSVPPGSGANQGDTKPFHGARRGGSSGSGSGSSHYNNNRNRSSGTGSNGDKRKENLAPNTTSTQAVPPTTGSAAHRPGSAGTGSGRGRSTLGHSSRPANENTEPSYPEDDIRHAIQKLSIEDSSAPEAAAAMRTETVSSAAPIASSSVTSQKTPSLPVPVVVSLPGAAKASQPAASNDDLTTAANPTAAAGQPVASVLPGLIESKTEEERVEREYHLKFMREALDMGQLALDTNETPVGCVLVYHGRTIAKGMNATNITRNGTRHAEFMALSALLSHREGKDVDVDDDIALDDARWGDVDPKDGHIFPYGQKLHPAPAVDQGIIKECILYVTVEPCVMCASLLRQLGIKKVYFGAVNDKFGGTGGVFRIHLNSKPVPKPEDRPYQNGYGPQDAKQITKGRATIVPRGEEDGDGGNVESGYPVEGGYLRDDAVSLLRRFYVQENGRAPQPRKKEGRAARLYAMEAQAKGGGLPESADATTLPTGNPDEAELADSNGEDIDEKGELIDTPN